MVLQALVAGFVITAPPSGWTLQRATEYDGRQVGYYWHDTGDPSDSPLTLEVAAPELAAPAADTTVHGQPADLEDLTSDGQVYGRSLRWREADRELTVGFSGKPSDAKLHAIAESVQPVPAERWQALMIATSGPPERVPAGSKRVVVRRSGGATMTALLPPGFPVAPEDKRLACLRVRFRGDTETTCDRNPSWERIGGSVFVFGTISPRVRRVRLVAEGVGRVTVPAVRVRDYGVVRFYAARLPSKTCQVELLQRPHRAAPRHDRPGGGWAGARQAALPAWAVSAKIKGPGPFRFADRGAGLRRHAPGRHPRPGRERERLFAHVQPGSELALETGARLVVQGHRERPRGRDA